MSNFFRLNGADFAKGLALAMITALLSAILEALKLHSFDFMAYDWSGIMSATLTAFVAYLGKNFISDKEGKVLGRIG